MSGTAPAAQQGRAFEESVFGSTLLVHGPETLLSDRAVARRIRAARAQDPAAEVVRLSGTGMDGAAFLEASGGSLFSEATVLVVTELCDVDKDLFEMVAATAANPPAELCLVLVHPGGTKGRGLVDRLRKAGVERVDAGAPKPWKIPDFIRDEARANGLQMDGQAAEALHRALGNDLRTLSSALAQLESDCESPRIDAQAVTTYFGGRAEVKGYAVSDALLAGDVARALEQLRWALSTGTAPVQVTSALSFGLRGLGLYLDLRTARMSDMDIAKAIGTYPGKIKEYSRIARAWNKAGLAHAITAVARADAGVKGASVDAEYALEAVLLEVDAARRGALPTRSR
ncbi:DNA polymerase III subunit delta [Acidipropionibacterium virtanenii]|uniref:DNA polymerase III subunit delta n=1 Tax=Acidipropionibacterium virtanenii TaxID=2057246 RepID=UPI001FEB37D8|nr:DNA polymerase III subunit delta [Acidipropionibacterium virtanenii]